MIGLTGPQGVGKTTLAEAAAKKLELPFVRTTASAVFARHGLSPATKLAFDDRIAVQREILAEFDAQYGSVSDGRFISDRTPIDMIAYTLAEIDQTVLTPEQEKALMSYITECENVTNRRFSALVVLYPGIPVVENREGKATHSAGFVEHISRIIMGSVADKKIDASHFYIPRYMTDLDQRVAAIEHVYSLHIKRQMQYLKDAENRGESVVLH